MSTGGGPRTGTCESCGRDGETVFEVTRLYVTPEAWDTEARVDVAGTEWWCTACRTHYPHLREGADTGWPTPG